MFDLLSGSKAEPLTPLVRGVHAWPLADGSYAVSDGKTLSRIDPFTGSTRTIALPHGIVAGRIASVSPDGSLVAAWSSSTQGHLDFGRVASGEAIVETTAAFTPKASVIWPADARFAIVADGPPIGFSVVRMAP